LQSWLTVNDPRRFTATVTGGSGDVAAADFVGSATLLRDVTVC